MFRIPVIMATLALLFVALDPELDARCCGGGAGRSGRLGLFRGRQARIEQRRGYALAPQVYQIPQQLPIGPQMAPVPTSGQAPLMLQKAAPLRMMNSCPNGVCPIR